MLIALPWLPRASVKWAWLYLKGGSKPARCKHILDNIYLTVGGNLCHRTFKMPRPNRRSYSDHPSSETRLRVLLDMDQVLADFEAHFLVKYREKHPDLPYIPYNDRDTFFLADQYAKLGPDIPEKVRDIYKTKNFFLELPEIEGSIAAAKEMVAMEGVDVFICTSPLTYYRYCLREKFAWMENHLGASWLDRIIITKDKSMVNGHILIDDRPNVYGACKQPSWEHIVFTSNANKSIDIKGKRRLQNWTDGKWRELIEDFKKRI